MNVAVETARRLLEIKAVRLSPNEPFTWASGMLSPIYCDNRLTLSHPATRNFLKKCMLERSAAFGEFDVVAGVATGGIPMGALLADALEKPFIYVRSAAKDHGRRNMVEGEYAPGARVLVIEDLISTGGSSMKAVEALRDAGTEVIGVLAVFQYGFEAAKSLFAEQGVALYTLTDYETLIGEALAAHYISEADIKTLQAWRENPPKWGALYA